MKSKIWVVIVGLLIILPVTVTLIREYIHFGFQSSKVALEPAGTFQYNIKIHDPSVRGYLLLTPFEPFKRNQGKIMLMDMNGNILYQKEVGQPAYDLRQWNLDGKIYYSYIVNDAAAYHIRGINLTCGHVVITDSLFNEIKQVHLLPHNVITTEKRQDLDLHEFIMLSPDHYITIATYEKTPANIPANLHPANGIKVATAVIQEICNDSVIWQWDASAFPELYSTSTEHNHFDDTRLTQDYLHINSSFLDPRDSNLICSFRCTNQVIKIDRHTGKVMWRLGGTNTDFSHSADQKFLRQHDVTLTNDNKTMLMLDNGDSILRKDSRVLEFRLDEKHKKIKGFESFPITDTPCLFMGHVAKEGDDYFISGGTGMMAMLINRKTREKRFEMKMNYLSYRVYHIDSVYGLVHRN